MKKNLLINLLWVYAFIFNLNALELQRIATISITNDLKLPANPYIQNNSRLITKKDGSFFFEATAPWGSVAVIVKSNGQFFVRNPVLRRFSVKTNIIDSFVENNELKIIQRETSTSTFFTSSPEIILKTLSDRFYVDLVERKSNIVTSEYIVSSQSRLLVTNSEIRSKYAFFSKVYFDGRNAENIFINSENYRIQSAAFTGGMYNGQEDMEMNDKKVVMAQINGDIISFYRLIDPDFLPSPNRITLGPNQNGSITATVNNSEQLFLNIQSSTNLIDWNNFKTIQNEPSLEIVVPVNKSKEFIRVVE